MLNYVCVYNNLTKLNNTIWDISNTQRLKCVTIGKLHRAEIEYIFLKRVWKYSIPCPNTVLGILTASTMPQPSTL